METMKSKYIAPEIVTILLDNEISLSMESEPPIGPNETSEISLDSFENNPFDKNLV